jgi:outer membrane lipoprotein SlyB
MNIPTWRHIVMSAVLGTAVLTTACTTPGNVGTTSSAPVQSGTGVVESIDIVKGNDPGLIGAIIGGVAGGVVGTQIGSGRGTTVATIAGVLGGAFAGREVERRVQSRDAVHKVVVHMDNGTRQTIAMETAPAVRAGDRVRIDNGQIIRD